MKTYLALGDSYTIGEQVEIASSFAYQAVQLLRTTRAEVGKPGSDLNFAAPEIIAKTGWTTDELISAINQTSLLPAYDLVSLLIGVNNQYRGRSSENFKIEFDQLLQSAIQFAGGYNKNVFVLSIPDWGLTPFAEGKDRKKISAEIDVYNNICKMLTEQSNCNHIDITESQREDADREGFLAVDKLHPSGKEYAKWAKKLCVAIMLNG